jgi:hypothetical protein
MFAHTPDEYAITLEIEAGTLEERLTRGMGRAHLHTPIPSAVSGHGAPADVIPTLTYGRGHEAGCSIWWGTDGLCDCGPKCFHGSDICLCGLPGLSPKGCFCEGPCGHEFV